jgi:hypothetical protein
MSREETGLNRLNRLFEEAVRRHGGDLKKVADDVKMQIAGLDLGDRSSVDGALERLLAFRTPDFRRGPLN